MLWIAPPGPGTALRLVDAFSGLSAGFWLCERVRFRVAWRSCLHCVTRERALLRAYRAAF